MNNVTSIRVDYKHADGWHVFSAEAFPGLYVAHQDPERAFNDVPRVLEKLLKLNLDVNCEVKMELSLGEFLELHRHGDQPAQTSRPPAFASHRYAVYACG
jgi:hypothetical protein